MADGECVSFLQWALPQLGLRWNGFRNVRGQVCKRIGRRVAELGLEDHASYQRRLEHEPAEWEVLRGLCGVTISRFYRDRATWDLLRSEVLPTLASAATAAGEDTLRCWSIGCASGEEPYTLSILWELDLARRYPHLKLRVLATDFDDEVLSRARAAIYPEATLRELPEQWRERAFDRRAEGLRLRDEFRGLVELQHADIRGPLPEEQFRLILCRNMVFTYFDEPSQRERLTQFQERLAEAGALVLGKHERLPPNAGMCDWLAASEIYRRCSTTPTQGDVTGPSTRC